MPTGGVCRVCLATNVRMMTIGRSLQPVFRKLTDAPLHADGRPIVACYICHAQLLNAQRLMLRAVTAENALQDILDIYTVITESSVCSVDRRAAGLCPSLTISKLEYLDTLQPIQAQVKTEVEINHVNGNTEDSGISEEDGSAHAAAAFDVDVETVDTTEKPSTEPLTDAEATYYTVATSRIVAEPSSDVEANSPEGKKKGDGASFKCVVCPRVFKRACHLASHMTAHRAGTQETIYKKKTYKCLNCQQVFSYNSNLLKHNRNVHGENYKCRICEYQCATSDLLQSHVKMHSQDKKCRLCGRQFANKNSLLRHLTAHLTKKSYSCNQCPRKFIHKYHFEQHLESHTTENSVCKRSNQKKKKRLKYYECSICSQRYRHMSNLKYHLNTHAGVKPFRCDVCQLPLSTKQALINHILSKHGDKPFPCTECRRSFATREQLLAHTETHEPDDDDDEHTSIRDASADPGKLQCSLCPMQFSLKIAFRRHVISEHL